MSKRTRDWSVAAENLRDTLGRDDRLDPSICVDLGDSSPERIREWARRLKLATQVVLNCAEMWAREEAKEARRLAK